MEEAALSWDGPGRGSAREVGGMKGEEKPRALPSVRGVAAGGELRQTPKDLS